MPPPDDAPDCLFCFGHPADEDGFCSNLCAHLYRIENEDE